MEHDLECFMLALLSQHLMILMGLSQIAKNLKRKENLKIRYVRYMYYKNSNILHQIHQSLSEIILI